MDEPLCMLSCGTRVVPQTNPHSELALVKAVGAAAKAREAGGAKLIKKMQTCPRPLVAGRAGVGVDSNARRGGGQVSVHPFAATMSTGGAPSKRCAERGNAGTAAQPSAVQTGARTRSQPLGQV